MGSVGQITYSLTFCSTLQMTISVRLKLKSFEVAHKANDLLVQ